MQQTGREKERKEEDNDYVSVIVKRTDEALRHPDDILGKAIEDGIEQLDRGFLSLFLSAMAAGTILGFTAMSVAIAESQMLLLDPIYFARLTGSRFNQGHLFLLFLAHFVLGPFLVLVVILGVWGNTLYYKQ